MVHTGSEHTEQDLSQKTVIVLVILTVLISVFGTVAVLSEVNHYQPVPVSKPVKSNADVKLEIIDPASLEPPKSTGHVALNIINPQQHNR